MYRAFLLACGEAETEPETSARERARSGGSIGERQAATIHRRLEALGRLCGRDGGRRGASRRLRPTVEFLIASSRRYPTQRFRVHDESGTLVSALLVARQELLDCDARLARKVERALPARVREGLRRVRPSVPAAPETGPRVPARASTGSRVARRVRVGAEWPGGKPWGLWKRGERM